MYKTVLLGTFVNLFPKENCLHKFILEAHLLYSASAIAIVKPYLRNISK